MSSIKILSPSWSNLILTPKNPHKTSLAMTGPSPPQHSTLNHGRIARGATKSFEMPRFQGIHIPNGGWFIGAISRIQFFLCRPPQPPAPPRSVPARLRVTPTPREKEFSIDNLLVQIHSIIVMIKRTGLAPWEFEFTFPGSLTSTFLQVPDGRGGQGVRRRVCVPCRVRPRIRFMHRRGTPQKSMSLKYEPSSEPLQTNQSVTRNAGLGRVGGDPDPLLGLQGRHASPPRHNSEYHSKCKRLQHEPTKRGPPAHPTPYTLHPKPSRLTLHPKPFTLNPKPQTLNPSPLNPKP